MMFYCWFDFYPLQSLLDPYPAAQMKIYPVGSIVNSPKNNRPECKQPIRLLL
jgi:putative SOS response-associated peptidase YedK